MTTNQNTKDKEIKGRVLKMLNSKEMEMLRVFYEQSTVFNRLGVERSENRHSAFLKWFLNSEGDHGMGYEPLRLLLRLYCSKFGMHSFGPELTIKIIASDYKIDIIDPIAVEVSVGKLTKGKNNSKDRIDIWLVIGITCEIDGDTVKVTVPILIENKIHSGEGKDQTSRYYNAVTSYMAAQQGQECKFVGILLSPSGIAPSCSQFAAISYQELLEYVLEPAQILALNDAKATISAYIKNLSSIKSGDALAVSSEERSLVSRFMEEHGELVNMALVAAYPGKASSFVTLRQELQEEDKKLLLNVWNGNEDILVRVMCVTRHDMIDKLGKLFKGNNRDNTKYHVLHRGREIFQGARLSKVNAAIAIFKAYVIENPDVGLEQLRTAFPCDKINYYYGAGNYYQHMFYIFDEDRIDENGLFITEYDNGCHKGEQTLVKYDFKTDDSLLLDTRDGKVMCVKMWRKGDFDRLCQWIKTKKFDFIQVEQCL